MHEPQNTDAPSSMMRTLLGEILRVAKRARRTDTLRWHTVDSYAELLSESRPSILWLYGPAATSPNSTLLFGDLANDEIMDDHFRAPPTAMGVGLACLRDTLVSGSSLVGSSSALYRLEPLTPLYVDQYLSRGTLNNCPPVGNRRLARRAERIMPGLSVLLTHWNSAVYGHWLLENMPKLLLLRRVSACLPAFHIVLPRGLPTWVTNWIDFVLPGSNLAIYDERTEYLRCEALLMPTLLMHPEHFFHPVLESLLDELRKSVPTTTTVRRKLYITRVEPSRFRKLANESELEEIARQEGCTVLAPETLSIPEQIEAFGSADLIVGAFGSAMHNALFSPAGCKVLCLNWINGLQSRIAQLRMHEVGYLLPDSGVPVKHMVDAASIDYRIDARTFRACVRILMKSANTPRGEPR